MVRQGRRWRAAVLGLAMLAGGCSATTAAAGAVAAVQATVTVLRDVRAIVCTTKLDPLLGNPREGEPVYVVRHPPAGGDPPADGGADVAEGGGDQ